MKRISLVMVVLMACFMGHTSVNAQNLKSVLSNVVSKVTSGSTTSETSIVGTWKYSAPACELESDNLLAKAGGTLASSQVETKLSEAYTKLGLSSSTCSFTFDDDNNYTQTLNSKSYKGTYTFDSSENTITMKSSLGITLTAEVSVSGSTMTLLYDADKLLSLFKTAASVSSKVSSNSTLSTLSSLSDNYDGLKLGFELTK